MVKQKMRFPLCLLHTCSGFTAFCSSVLLWLRNLELLTPCINMNPYLPFSILTNTNNKKIFLDIRGQKVQIGNMDYSNYMIPWTLTVDNESFCFLW